MFALSSGDTVEPDASFVSQRRWDESPPPELGHFLRVVPDLVVEILSPSTGSRDRGEKKAIYASNGVREYWLIDARARSLTVHWLTRGTEDPGRILNADDRFESATVEGLTFVVRELFPK